MNERKLRDPATPASTRARYIPIEPSAPHPESGVQLRADAAARRHLPRGPHVDIGQSAQFPYRVLRDYNAARRGRREFALVRCSYGRLRGILAAYEARNLPAAFGVEDVQALFEELEPRDDGADVVEEEDGEGVADVKAGWVVVVALVILVLFSIGCFMIFRLH